MDEIKITNYINPFALECVMSYRGVSIGKLCKDCELSKHDLLSFFKGYFAVISEEKLKEIMIYLDWPFDFLYQQIKPVKSSLDF